MVGGIINKNNESKELNNSTDRKSNEDDHHIEPDNNSPTTEIYMRIKDNMMENMR